MKENTTEPDHNLSKDLILVSNMIRKADQLTPWNNNCFPRALTGKFYLNMRGISSTIFFGVHKNQETNILKAHAWLKTGDEFITGQKDHEEYTVVSYFT